jgi:hypothetical protein
MSIDNIRRALLVGRNEVNKAPVVAANEAWRVLSIPAVHESILGVARSIRTLGEQALHAGELSSTVAGAAVAAEGAFNKATETSTHADAMDMILAAGTLDGSANTQAEYAVRAKELLDECRLLILNITARAEEIEQLKITALQMGQIAVESQAATLTAVDGYIATLGGEPA